MRAAAGALIVLAACALGLALPWARDTNVHAISGLVAGSLYLLAGVAILTLAIATFALGAEWLSGRLR
jgi:hypothetical protein